MKKQSPRNWRTSKGLALSAMVGVTAVWGWTFIIVKDTISRMPVMDFLAVRFVAATAAMFVLRPFCLRSVTRPGLVRGAGLGAVLGLAYVAQTFGLLYAPAAVSGFITGMFVVLTPVVSWVILRHKTGRATWIAVFLATMGLGLLSLRGWSVGTGELLTLGCAFLLAVHILGLGEWSRQYEIYSFSLLQVATVAVIALAAALPGRITMPPDAGAWIAVAITAVPATAVAFLIQTWAQSLVSPVPAAVVLTMEPVFAGVFAFLIGGESLTPRVLAGGLCILIAILIVKFQPAHNPESGERHTLKQPESAG